VDCAGARPAPNGGARAFFHGLASYEEQRRRRIRELFAESEPALADAAADRRLALYLEHYRCGWCLFDDVLPCLEALRGYTLGIISNGGAARQRQKLRQTGIRHHFRAVVVSEEVGVAKPSPEIFRAACRLAGCRPADGVYVGDRLDTDVRGSGAVGMRGIWLNRHGAGAAADVETVHRLTELEDRLRPCCTAGRAGASASA
jgi:putative hydrolase of the HAD superfamily